MTLRSKVRRMVGLEGMQLHESSEASPATREDETQSGQSATRPIDLRLALDLIERASGEMTSVREQARAQRNVGSVLSAAREQVVAAGQLVADLQQQLRESDEKAQRLASELERAERRAARAARAEAELAELQLAISHGLSDGLLGARSPNGPKPISVRSSNRAHLTSDGFGREREQ
jgi:chaperonin cofactor prefoldin